MSKTLIAAARTFVLIPLFFVLTLVYSAFIIVYGIFRPAAPIFERIVKHWARTFLHIPPVQLTVEGIEHVDPHTRYVVVSNHLSTFDIPLLFAVLPIDGRFLAKKELFKIPLVAPAMRRIGIIEVDRQAGGSSRQAINDGVKLAAERGYSLIVFPEGTRSDAHELLPFKKGAFRIAIDTGLPILPVIIEGTDRISTPGSKLCYPGQAKIRVLPPIETADLTNRDDLTSLMRTTEEAITKSYNELQSRSDV
ncbi:MAG: 1-acyl-sn-glycerol-3-phosphate acyltransferase [Acidimicrobiia bacterium]|nr:1-acyl-sn-glycerol-3-phosphate acyltransferase [Acidimicrobiia bacterium]